MAFFKRSAMMIFMIFMIVTGIAYIFLAAGFAGTDMISSFVSLIENDIYFRSVLAFAGVLFILVGLVAPYRQSRSLNKARVVSFQNPDGEVTVSLSAIEEYIRKIAKMIPDIKDLKTSVDINKRGINVVASVSLAAGSNIPAVTEAIQSDVRSRVQAMLGVEEPVNIKMNINKILKGDAGMPVQSEQEDEPEEIHAPYREM